MLMNASCIDVTGLQTYQQSDGTSASVLPAALGPLRPFSTVRQT